jgi:hypothetical protein
MISANERIELVTYPQTRASRTKAIRWFQEPRSKATLARLSQMRTLVGRRMQARAARDRHWRSLSISYWTALEARSIPRESTIVLSAPTASARTLLEPIRSR